MRSSPSSRHAQRTEVGAPSGVPARQCPWRDACCNEVFAKLIQIYHAQNASGTVRPPLPK